MDAHMLISSEFSNESGPLDISKISVCLDKQNDNFPIIKTEIDEEEYRISENPSKGNFCEIGVQTDEKEIISLVFKDLKIERNKLSNYIKDSYKTICNGESSNNDENAENESDDEIEQEVSRACLVATSKRLENLKQLNNASKDLNTITTNIQSLEENYKKIEEKIALLSKFMKKAFEETIINEICNRALSLAYQSDSKTLVNEAKQITSANLNASSSLKSNLVIKNPANNHQISLRVASLPLQNQMVPNADKEEKSSSKTEKNKASNSASNVKTNLLNEKLANGLSSINTDIKIKEEPIDDREEVFTTDIKIKEEKIDEYEHPLIANLPAHLLLEQPNEEHTYIISDVTGSKLNVKQELDEDDFSYFNSQFPGTSGQSRNNDDDDEDEFQYNTVNSFKSDLATRRSVSHTVVSGKSDKSKAEAALLAMKELMKIEQDKKVERERSAAGLNQVEKPKTMNVSLNVNGMRVVTKVSLPSVGAVPKKLVKSVEEECKYQCPICFIKFKTDGQLIGHKRIHDTAKAKLNTADMTKNVYKEVKMRIEQIGNRRSIHVLLPYYDYAFIVTNSTANKLYMKCFRQACEVKAYSTNDGKFFVKVGEEHCHGPDSEVILSKIDEKKRSDLEKTEVINKSVHDAIAQKQKQKNLMEEKKSALIERIKRSQEAAGGNKIIHEAKRRKI